MPSNNLHDHHSLAPELGPGPDLLKRTSSIPSAGTRASRYLRRRLTRQRVQRTPGAPASTAASIPPRDKLQAALLTENIVPPTLDGVLATIYPPPEIVLGQHEEDIEYDGLAPYGVVEEEERAGVEREIRRLIDVIQNPDTPLVLAGCRRLGAGDTVGYTGLTTLARMLIDVNLICQTDNDGISLIHAPIEISVLKFRKAMHRLRRVETTGQMAEKLLLARTQGGTTGPVWASADELVEDAKALLDLTTACVARYATQVARGNGWRDRQLGALAKLTAKAKALLPDVAGNAATAMRNADLALSTLEDSWDKDGPDGAGKDVPAGDGNELYLRFAQVLENYKLSDTDYVDSLMYRVSQQRNRAGVKLALDYALMSLLPGDLHPGFGVTEYEVCGVVMETGFEDFQTLLFQDRDFEYSGTSDADQLNFAHPAFRMIDALATYMEEKSKEALRVVRSGPPPPAPSLPAGPAPTAAEPKHVSVKTETMLEWNYSVSPFISDEAVGKERERGGVHAAPGSCQSTGSLGATGMGGRRTYPLTTMSDIITFMVPIALASPVVSGHFKRFLDMFYLTRNSDDLVRPFAEKPFNAFVRLYTNDFEVARRERLPPDVLHLADAVHSGLFSRSSLLNADEGGSAVMTRPSSSKAGISVPSLDKRNEKKMAKKRRQRDKKLSDAHEIMNSWVYTENGVVVACGLYVWLTVIFAAILVIGGLVIGLTLQTRLTGVDPFNITMYAWALGALELLVFKSRLVEEWPWSDFVHSRVKCRSVSELKAVTGIHDQLIVAKLLHDERTSILMTRGPYNAVFLQKSDAGFSIDVPLKNKTLLLSGLVMVKVEAPIDHALVCLDLRRGTELRTVFHREVGTETKRLVCPSIERLAHATPSKGPDGGNLPKPRFPLTSRKLEWRKVEGVYSVLDAEFV